MNYIAMINQQGYLPEAEPEIFDTEKECLDYLFEELERDFDNTLEGLEDKHHIKNLMVNYESAMQCLQKNHCCVFGSLYYGVEPD